MTESLGLLLFGLLLIAGAVLVRRFVIPKFAKEGEKPTERAGRSA